MNLKLEDLLNKLPYKKIKEDPGAKAKTFFSPLLKINNIIKERIKDKIKNINFQKNKTDLLYKIKENKYIDKIKKYGYKKTTEEEYEEEPNNAILSVKEVNNVSPDNFKNTININGKKLNLKYNNKEIFFLDFVNKQIKYKSKIISEIEILDIKVKKEDMHMLIKERGEFFYLKTNINLEILNKNIISIPYIEKIKLEKDYGDIFKIGINEVYFNSFRYNKKRSFTQIELCKKYYFEVNGSFYLNNLDKEIKKYLNMNPIQIEHLHMYDWVNILGLNDYKVNDKKINSFLIDYFKKINHLKFDNTINGTLNFFDFGEDKSYKVFERNKDFIVYGNFINSYQKGNYEIELKILEETEQMNDELKIKATLYENSYRIKSIQGPTFDKNFIFCNLFFKFRKVNYSKKTLKLKVNVKDEYSAKFMIKKEKANQIIKDNIEDINFKENNKFLKKSEFINEKIDVFIKDSVLNISNIETKYGFLFNNFFAFVDANSVISSDLPLRIKSKVHYSFKQKENRYVYKFEEKGRIFLTPDINKKIKLLNDAGEPTEFFKNIKKPSYFINVYKNEKDLFELTGLYSKESKIKMEYEEGRIKTVKSYNKEGQLLNKKEFLYNDENRISGETNTNEYSGEEILKIKNNDYILNFKEKRLEKEKDLGFKLKNEKSQNSIGIISIPKPKECIFENNTEYRNIEIKRNNYYKEVFDYSKDLLLTEKFKTEPLFHKFITNKGFEALITEKGQIVNNILTEEKEDYLIVYFNAENNKKYLETKSGEQKSYIEYIKAYESFNGGYIDRINIKNEKIEYIKRDIKNTLYKAIKNNKAPFDEIEYIKKGIYYYKDKKLIKDKEGNITMEEPKNSQLIFKQIDKKEDRFYDLFYLLKPKSKFYDDNFKRVSLPTMER